MGALLAGVFCGVLDERLAMVALKRKAEYGRDVVVEYEDECKQDVK